MGFLDKYNIQFNVLVRGENEFKFDVNNKFFEHFNITGINNVDIIALIKVEKSANLLIFRFLIAGVVNVPCDRCLDDFNLEINISNEVYIKFVTSKTEEQSENLLNIRETENEINIAHYLYEFISLSLPIKKVHPDNEKGKSTCNKEMLDRINNFNSDNNNNNVSVWNKLNKLKNGTS